MLLIPTTIVNATSPTSSSQEGVPVILDGKFYQPTEFNIIVQQFNARGVYVYCTIDNGIEYAFSNLNDFCNKYSVHFDISSKTINQDMQQTDNQIKPLTFTGGFAYNWININQGGNCLALQESLLDNFSGQWLNSISSIYFASKRICQCSRNSLEYDLIYKNTEQGYFEPTTTRTMISRDTFTSVFHLSSPSPDV